MASAATELQRLAPCITAHSWNADFTRVAICPNNNTVQIYAKSGNNYTLEFTLDEHDQVVTGIDWAPKTNRIVTSSQDRNAYVWTFTNGTWKPTLVILRINRAATHVKWSPAENKFAVASGAKCVSVCYFEEDNDWWVSKHIRKHKSTVLKVDWHPNNVLLCTSSSDFKCRVFSAFIKDVDGKPPATPFGPKLTFGECFLEFDAASGWVHAAKWSPSGNTIAFVGHDSSINFATVAQQATVQSLKLSTLPFRDLLFLTERSVVAVGEDANPYLFTSNDSGHWTLISELDKGEGAAGAPKGGNTAMNIFKGKVDLGQDAPIDTKLTTLHQNTITAISALGSAGGRVNDFSTSGLDGAIAIWHTKTLESKLAAVKIA
eukprot:TRINITY_DN2480_c0_g1_i1.p1 TRINITY_DN2480_c0_g1~~TRINITY_DN2480_c0_g1_i1.p1  ORF type:complete len:375 (-),score=160.29 TRINITY_DN2480_c0_g1_i1:91-1215(-)